MNEPVWNFGRTLLTGSRTLKAQFNVNYAPADDFWDHVEALRLQGARSQPTAIQSLQSFDVAVSVSDRAIEVRVADHVVRFDTPKERDGYAALLFRGQGYVAVRSIKLADAR